MQLFRACIQILEQLEDALNQIRSEDFNKTSSSLSNSTIGQHLRHTLEFFICLDSGFKSGIINYDKREHNKLIESDKFIALSVIAQIKDFISSQKTDKELLLEVGYEHHSDQCVTIATNYYRELTYNIEHAIHHMALMKIGFREIAPYVKLANHFGVAVSTIRYQDAVALQPTKE